MVIFRLFMYTLMGWNPASSIASPTKGYSHSPPTLRFDVVPVNHHASRRWNPARTLSISPVTTYLLLPCNSTNWATSLYIAPWDRTISPILSITLATMPLRLQPFRRFC